VPAQEVSVLPRVEASVEARFPAADDSESGGSTDTNSSPPTVQTVAVVHRHCDHPVHACDPDSADDLCAGESVHDGVGDGDEEWEEH